uniref:O-acyltransferase (Membrane bound) domain containing protein, putative n=1 Tax=Arundo donax TaxID=35708 RepID=A0A0A9EDU5_ARUDO
MTFSVKTIKAPVASMPPSFHASPLM